MVLYFRMIRLKFRHIRAIVFCIGFSLTIWRSYDCIDKYLQFNPVTKVDMVNSENTLAPALILCPEYYSAYNQIKERVNNKPNVSFPVSNDR